jgi:hypothetical protein
MGKSTHTHFLRSSTSSKRILTSCRIGIRHRRRHLLRHHGADILDPRYDEENVDTVRLGHAAVVLLDCAVRHLRQGELPSGCVGRYAGLG